MKKIVLIFIGIVSFSLSSYAREKAPIRPRKCSKTIIVEKIVEKDSDLSTVINTTNINVNIGMCEDVYKQKTITYCAGVDGCRNMSNIEVLMAIEPTIQADCRGIAQNTKLTAISGGMGVHLKCLNGHGLFDLSSGLCKYIVELRRGKKVKVTTEVLEGKQYICKDLFPEYQKKRTGAIIAGGLLGATTGVLAGGLIYQRYFGFHKDLHTLFEKECGIEDKAKRKVLIKKLKKDTFQTWEALVKGLEKDGGLTPNTMEGDKEIAGTAQKCAEYFYNSDKLKNVQKQTGTDTKTNTKASTILEDTELWAILKQSIFFANSYHNLEEVAGIPSVYPVATETLDDTIDILSKPEYKKCVKLKVIGHATDSVLKSSNGKWCIVGKLRKADKIKYEARAREYNPYPFSNQKKEDYNLECNKMLAIFRGEAVYDYIKNNSDLFVTNEDPQLTQNTGNTSTKNDITGRTTTIEFNFSDCGADKEEIKKVLDKLNYTSKNMRLNKRSMYSKQNFMKGALIGAPIGSLLGLGIGDLLTRYKCYLSNTGKILAKWKETFKINP